jgi:hypothetical protein
MIIETKFDIGDKVLVISKSGDKILKSKVKDISLKKLASDKNGSHTAMYWLDAIDEDYMDFQMFDSLEDIKEAMCKQIMNYSLNSTFNIKKLLSVTRGFKND